jgi:hypothetical protein
MLIPSLSSRVEQQRDFVGKWVKSSLIWPFGRIAATTGKTQVIRVVASTVLLRAYVLDLKGDQA